MEKEIVIPMKKKERVQLYKKKFALKMVDNVGLVEYTDLNRQQIKVQTLQKNMYLQLCNLHRMCITYS